MIGMGNVRYRRIVHVRARRHELVLQRGDGVDREVGEIAALSLQVHLQPILVTTQPAQVLPDHPKAVDVAAADMMPVVELDAKLEGSLRRLQEPGFVKLEQLVVLLDRGNGRLADADRADVFGLDQPDSPWNRCASSAAAIQPEEPPPTIRICLR